MMNSIWGRVNPDNEAVRGQRQEEYLNFLESPWQLAERKNEIANETTLAGDLAPEPVEMEKGPKSEQAVVGSSTGMSTDQEECTRDEKSIKEAAPLIEKVTGPKHLSDIRQDKDQWPVLAAKDDEWSDLLLELTLGTAYANIMENTPVLDAFSALSFVGFFSLVWWIWASQVAYNVRFRTRDYMHRIFSVLQFVIFCAMATFTSNFNILAGLLADDAQSPINPVEFQISNTDFNSVFASSLREERLPVLNARGISLVMGFSRLLLLIQYIIVFAYSNTVEAHKKYQNSLKIHLGTLVLSSAAYFLAFGIIGQEPTKGETIGKLILWFTPMFLEVLSYFIAARMKYHVGFDTERMHTRSASLFIVVLGEGLNQITGSFKYIVGAIGFTIQGLGIMLSAAIIIIGQLSLYFRNNWKKWHGTQHTLLWFFSHYIYMACLILALQGVRYLLSFANLYSAINDLLSLADKIANEAHYRGVKKLTPDQFPDVQNAFLAIGLPFGDFINVVNAALANPFNSAAATKLAQTLIYVASVTFNEFDAFPEQGTNLYNQVQDFLDAPSVNPHTVFTLLGHLLSSRLQSAFWFWGVAGGTLIMLAGMSVLKQRPADRYELASVVVKFGFGAAYLCLSALTTGHNEPYFANASTATVNLRTSKAWRIASTAWVIPSFAITLILVNCIDIILERIARSQYGTAVKDYPNKSPKVQYEAQGHNGRYERLPSYHAQA